MPPPWSFLRTNSGSGFTPNRNPPGSGRDKPLPGTPATTFDPPPTLTGRDGERAHASPPRPQTLGTERHHRHNRSVSHPLPKIFGRKKSAGNLGNGNQGIDGPLDDDLVPVLDEPPASTPTRVISGKKGRVDEDENKLQMRCMCCSSRVKVPKDLDKFRCVGCLCINDLTPMEEQEQESTGSKGTGKKAEMFPGGLPPSGKITTLSVERTRAIIDRCLMAYLESRCRREEEPPIVPKRPESPLQTPEEKENPLGSISIYARPEGGEAAKQLTDAVMASSPPDTPQNDISSSVTSVGVRNMSHVDPTPSSRTDAPPPVLQPTPHGPGPPHTVARKPLPKQPIRKPPPTPINLASRGPSQRLHLNSTSMTNGDSSTRPPPSPRPPQLEAEQRKRYERVKSIFRGLEDYIINSFGDFKILNSSFCSIKPVHTGRTRSENNIVTPPPEPAANYTPSPVDLSQLDAKTLLLGDIGENSTWWTGRLNRNDSDKVSRPRKAGEVSRRLISSRSPNINWAELNKWYELVHSAGIGWQHKVDRVRSDAADLMKERLEGYHNFEEIEEELTEARDHTIRTLLKVTENLLKRPGRLLNQPQDLRFLLIILANPSIYPSRNRGNRAVPGASPHAGRVGKQNSLHPSSPKLSPKKSPGHEAPSQQHTGILKRTFGLLANTNDICHRYLVGWFSRFDEAHFTRIVDLIASFVTHRIARTSSRPRSRGVVADGGLIPDLSGSAMSTSAQLHSAMGLSGSVKKRADDPDQEPEYANDWQIKVAAKTISLFFAANNIWQGKRRDENERVDSAIVGTGPARAKRSGQLLHTSSFYNTLLDYGDIIADFKVWELKRDRFAFCQYPFFLSMGSKIKILEYDARRQMEIKAREAYFDSVISKRALDGYFHLRVRRECMVDDSLRQISEAVGSGPEELKKGLRVHFTGEEGVDAGGPRKEWFLMLVRDIFDPNHGLFVYDDESLTCYFNPNSFETSDQYYLVGALLGLAIYNSTILDIALPPFAFRKLLAAAPASAISSANVSSLTGTKGQMTYTLSDLAEFRPSLAAGLQKLLDFDGDVQETYCWDFVAPVERYGTVVQVPLMSNGEGTPVTNANRHEFVDAYIRYLLDGAVTKQFEPFKRGFFQVCAGNALSLFRAEEIELLVRGSDEALDVNSLRAVAVYENWRHPDPPHALIAAPADSVPVIQWFWAIFAAAAPDRQRKLLTFITGTDRIPAVGATSLILRIVAGGSGGAPVPEELGRFPVARTCFNMLVLWRYERRDALEEKLWRAVEESEGFGLK